MKELVMEVTNSLPDTATIDDIIEAIYIRLKIEEGIKDAENNNELTTEECFHVIDELVLHGFKHLKITGGEPFIRKDIIEILRYASEKLVTDISTNASLITPEKVRLLNEIKL